MTDSQHDEIMLLDPSSGHKQDAADSSVQTKSQDDKQRPSERSASALAPAFVEFGDYRIADI
jgi:hypothetical protein